MTEPERRPLASGAVMSGMSRVAVAAMGAVTTIVLARLLGPSGAGAFAVAQTVILMLTVATTLGVEHGIVYYVSSGRWSPVRAWRASQRLALVCGVAGIGAALAARALVPNAFRGLSPAMTLVVVVALPFALSWFYASYVALATDRYEAYALPPAIQSALAMSLVTALAAIDGIAGAVLGFTIAHVVTALVTRALGRRERALLSAPDERSRRRQLRRAVSFGIMGYAANALQLVNYRLDLFILNAAAASAAVGHYSVAVSITSVMWLLPLALSDVLLPRVAALSGQSDPHRVGMLKLAETKSLRHCVLLSLIVTVVLALALTLLVVPIYGDAFHQATALGLILLPGAALLGICGPLSATIVGRGRPGVLLAVTIVVTPLTVVLYLLLIPTLHAAGAALASSISYTATFALTAFGYGRVTGSNPLRLMLPTKAEFADYLTLLRLARDRLGVARQSFGRQPANESLS